MALELSSIHYRIGSTTAVGAEFGELVGEKVKFSDALDFNPLSL